MYTLNCSCFQTKHSKIPYALGLCLAGKPECFGDGKPPGEHPSHSFHHFTYPADPSHPPCLHSVGTVGRVRCCCCVDGGKPIGAQPGYPTCDKYYGHGVLHKEAVLTQCEAGNEGVLCATCEDGMFKMNKACISCPDPIPGFFLYLLAPLFWLFCFFPAIKYVIGQKITPSLFITLPYMQISAIIGAFGFSYPDAVKATSSLFKVVNFGAETFFAVLNSLVL